MSLPFHIHRITSSQNTTFTNEPPCASLSIPVCALSRTRGNTYSASSPTPKGLASFFQLYRTPLTEYVMAHKNYLASYTSRFSRPNKAFAPHRAQKKTRLQSEPPLKVRFLVPTLRGSSKRQVPLYSVIPYSFSFDIPPRLKSREYVNLTHKRR